jgi:ribose transport system substrate-binding protein
MKFSKMGITFLAIIFLLGILGSTFVYAENQKVVSTFNTLNNEYFISWDKGCRAAAEALGITYEPITTQGDANKEMSSIESALSSGVKIFATAPIGAQSVPAITKLVNDNDGFISITWDIPEWFTPLDVGDGFTTYLRPDIEKESYELAKLLFDYIEKKGRVIHITGLPGTTGDMLVTAGVNRALKEYPDIELVGQLPGNYNRVDSQRVMENLLTAYPEFDAVFGQNDSTAIGALAAIETSGREIVPIVGLDGTKEALDLIKMGKLFATVSAFPEWQGGYGVVRAYDAANGYKPSVAERMMYTGYAIITKDNVDEFLNKMYGSDELPFDWKLMSKVLNPDTWDPQNSVTPIDPTNLWNEDQKPAGYEIPSVYLDAVENDELERVTKEYQDHYKRKLF